MAYRNTEHSWGAVTRLLHWLMAALLLAQSGLGWVAGSMARSPRTIDMMTAHKSLGITLLLLVLLRLAWRWSNPRPKPLTATGTWPDRVAQLLHATLYMLMIMIPLSGWAAASSSIIPWKLWWLIPWPRIVEPDKYQHEMWAAVHEYAIWTLGVLLALHIAAALKHHFVDQDNTLKRMWSDK